jgi:biotin carboxylase
MKKILILGADKYYQNAIRSVRNKGLYVITIDKNPQALAQEDSDEFYPIDFSNKEETLALALEKEIDAIIPLNDWGVPTASYVSQKLNLEGITQEKSDILTNKFLMRELWSKNGIKSPQYRLIDTLEQAINTCQELTFPLIFKPIDSRGGASRGVMQVNSLDDVEKGFKFAKEFYQDSQVIIEEFLIGLEHSVEVLVENHNIYILAISDKVKTPLPYRVDKEVIYPTSLKDKSLLSLQQTIIDCIKALDIKNGAFHLELCTINDTTHIPFEVGGRCGGGRTSDPIVKYVSGVDMFYNLCKILLNMEVSPKELEVTLKNDCVYHFITPSPGKVVEINEELLKSNQNVIDYGIYVNIGDTINSVKVGGDRSGFVVYKGRNFNSDKVVITE